MASYKGALDFPFTDKAPLSFFLPLTHLDLKGKEISRFITASFQLDPNKISVEVSVLLAHDSELSNLSVKFVLDNIF